MNKPTLNNFSAILLIVLFAILLRILWNQPAFWAWLAKLLS